MLIRYATHLSMELARYPYGNAGSTAAIPCHRSFFEGEDVQKQSGRRKRGRHIGRAPRGSFLADPASAANFCNARYFSAEGKAVPV